MPNREFRKATKMSKNYEYTADAYRASSKGERREKKRQRQQTGPQVARYGVWTGEGYLREGLGLEKKLASQSLTLEGKTFGKNKKKGRKSDKDKRPLFLSV